MQFLTEITKTNNTILGFDVHGSVHLDNVYVQLKVQLDVHVFICILYSSIFFALHVSGAICTHPQEHKLQRTAIDVYNGFGMLIHWSRYWLRHPHTFSTVKIIKYEVKWSKGRWSDVKWILEAIHSTFLTGCCIPYCTCCMLSCLVYFDVSSTCLVCIVVRWNVCMVVAVLCMWSSYVYFLYWVYWCFTLDAGLLARSQYLEGPVTSHLNTGFSWFPCV
jgi:hypothetical protein